MHRLLAPALALALFAAGAAVGGGAGRERPAETTEPVLASPPRLLRDVPPELPPDTAFPAPEVTVVLRIDVGADGRVEQVALEQGAGPPFDAAAVAAAGQYLFEPGRLTTGEPVPVTITWSLAIRAPPSRPAAPPPVKLSGRLLQRGSRVPLGGVTVTAERGGEELARATADAEGRFALTVPGERFTVRAAVPDHDRLEAPVEARPGEERDETFYLLPLPTGSSAVVRGERIRREVTRQVIPAAEVAQVAGSQGDTLKAVLNLPGAARPAYNGGALVLRGSSPGDSAAFVEGLEIPVLYHFGGLRSTFAPRFLESVEFVPGNLAPDYGRLTGGIVNARVRDPSSDLLRGEADFNAYDAGVALEGPVSKSWSVGGAFRRSWIDALLPLFISSDANVSFTTAPRFYDYQFLATWKPDERDSVRLLFFGSQDKLALVVKRPDSDPTLTGDLYARIAYHELQASWRRVISPTLRHESWVAAGLQDIDTSIGQGLFFRLGVQRLDARSTFTWQASPTVEARAGLDVQAARFDVSLDAPLAPTEGQPPPPVSTRPRVVTEQTSRSAAPAAFAELRVTAAPGLEVLPSVRVDWSSAIRQASVDPRLAVRWTVAAGTVLKAAAGVQHQEPAANQSAREVGNPDLGFLRSFQYSLGLERRLAEGLDLDTTAFYKDLSDRVVANPAFNLGGGAPPYVNGGTGRIYGLELLLRARLGERFFGWIAYTFQRSYRTDGPGQPERPFSFDQPHILTALGTWKPNPRWSFGARFRLVSGNPYTPVRDSLYDAATDVYVPVYGPVNSARLGTFHALDLRVDRLWTFERWRLGVYLDVQNVYNRGNQEGWQYRYDYGERQPLTGLPILPILGAKAEW